MFHTSDPLDVPDPSSSRLLHPLDVRGARGPYALAVVLAAIASPSVLLAFVLLLLVVSDNVITAFAGPAVGLTATAYAERRFRADAWAHIPRRRQDLLRTNPSAWSVLVEVLVFAALAASLVVFAAACGDSAAPIGDAMRSAGMGAIAGIALVALFHGVWDRSTEPGRRVSLSPLPLSSGFRVASLFAMAIVCAVVADGALDNPAAVGTAAAVVLVTAGLWAVFRAMPSKIPCLPPRVSVP